MERCPYCGASVRSGARFCTSCGRRLTPTGGDAPAVTETPAGNEPAAASAEPDSAAPAGQAWDGGPTAEQPAAATEDWFRRNPVASADLWPAAARVQDAQPSQGPAPNNDQDRAPGQASEPPTDEANWPSSPWSTWTMPQEVEAEAEAPPVSDTQPEADHGQPETGAATTEEATPDEPAFVAVPQLDADDDRADRRDLAAPAASEPASGQTLHRALALLDELRGLLPALAGADVTGAVELLASARSEAGQADPAALARLETAVRAVQERPREIDALLGLAGNLEALATVVAAHQRYRTAIESALSLLGRAGESATTESDRGEAFAQAEDRA